MAEQLAPRGYFEGVGYQLGKSGYLDTGPEAAGKHRAYGDVGRFLIGGLTPEQQAYSDYVDNMLGQPIEAQAPYAERYAGQATKAARPGLMNAGQQARKQAAGYLARQGAPTGRTAATQAQISNSLAQSMAAMQASAMAQGMQQHEQYRQNEQARRDAAVGIRAGMRGQEGLLPAAVSYFTGRGIDTLTGNFGGQGFQQRGPYTPYPGDSRRMSDSPFDWQDLERYS